MSRLFLLSLFLCSVFLACSTSVENIDFKAEFDAFVSKYERRYASDEEYVERLIIFKRNYLHVQELNSQAPPPAVFGVTRFMDLTPEEFKAKYLNFRPNKTFRPNNVDVWQVPANEQAAPTKFDWRTKGAVTAVKDQGQCGSCWAFSTAEEVESMWFLKGNKLVELSPQQIVSCDKGNGDQGCGGGDTVTAYQYVKSKGLEGESSYPYTSGDSGDDGTCKYDSSKVIAKISGFTYATPPCKDSCLHQNETTLELALASRGPVSICVYAASWQFYSGGIFRRSCPSAYDTLDHCVQLVGYDKSGSIPYWLVRNSWASSWGVDGYIHIEMGKNLCGIADEATFATAA